jgi:hypothetical protein
MSPRIITTLFEKGSVESTLTFFAKRSAQKVDTPSYRFVVSRYTQALVRKFIVTGTDLGIQQGVYPGPPGSLPVLAPMHTVKASDRTTTHLDDTPA